MNILAEGTSWPLRGIALWLVVVALAAIAGTVALSARRRRSTARSQATGAARVEPPTGADSAAQTGPATASGCTANMIEADALTARAGSEPAPSPETVPTSPTVPVWRMQATAWRQATEPEPIPAPPEVPDDSASSALAYDEEQRKVPPARIPPPPSVP